jgi:uncharacterized heparinase superfamily protein
LWRYNLHYFDDLVAEGAANRVTWHQRLIEQWIAGNPAGEGTAWEPYPVSLRLVNWIKWELSDFARARLPPAAVHSLAVQARWLRKRLEIHLLGNHLWANAKALTFVGAFFGGAEGDAWREKGLSIIQRELEEQILSDGGHFERTPMYHAILLEDLLDLVQLSQRYPGLLPEADVSRWRETIAPMFRWLDVMTHPDGGISFFNDAALGVAPNLASLRDYAATLGVPDEESPIGDLEILSESGYVRLQTDRAVLIADAGPIGPDYMPGHAHADTLSFELSLDGQRVVVNSGTSTYEADAERLRQRGTAAHNTVVVDGKNSSEVWSSFRVARRARPLEAACGRDGDTLVLRGTHDGYRRLPGRVLHSREWRLKPTGLQVIDRLQGAPRSAEVRFHLAPGVQPSDVGMDISLMKVAPSTWHPRFGESVDNAVFVRDFDGENVLETVFCFPPVKIRGS